MFKVSDDIMHLIFITVDENKKSSDYKIGDTNTDYIIETACSGCHSGCVGSCLNVCSGSGKGASGSKGW